MDTGVWRFDFIFQVSSFNLFDTKGVCLFFTMTMREFKQGIKTPEQIFYFQGYRNTNTYLPTEVNIMTVMACQIF